MILVSLQRLWFDCLTELWYIFYFSEILAAYSLVLTGFELGCLVHELFINYTASQLHLGVARLVSLEEKKLYP